jgi:hypothetical protein
MATGECRSRILCSNHFNPFYALSTHFFFITHNKKDKTVL